MSGLISKGAGNCIRQGTSRRTIGEVVAPQVCWSRPHPSQGTEILMVLTVI